MGPLKLFLSHFFNGPSEIVSISFFLMGPLKLFLSLFLNGASEIVSISFF